MVGLSVAVEVVERVYREEWGRFATLIRVASDIRRRGCAARRFSVALEH
jgi:hypothetical protein